MTGAEKLHNTHQGTRKDESEAENGETWCYANRVTKKIMVIYS